MSNNERMLGEALHGRKILPSFRMSLASYPKLTARRLYDKVRCNLNERKTYGLNLVVSLDFDPLTLPVPKESTGFPKVRTAISSLNCFLFALIHGACSHC